MSLREQLESKNCFKIFKIPEWNTGEAEYSLRSLTSDDAVLIQKRPDENGIHFGARAFSLLFGNSVGDRVYGDSDEEIAAILKTIPLVAIQRVVTCGMEFNQDAIKKN